MRGDCTREGGSFILPCTTETITVCVQCRLLQLVKLVDRATVRMSKLLGIQSVKYFAMESNPARSSNKVSLVRPEGNQHVKKIMNGARYWSDQEAIDV